MSPWIDGIRFQYCIVERYYPGAGPARCMCCHGRIWIEGANFSDEVGGACRECCLRACDTIRREAQA